MAGSLGAVTAGISRLIGHAQCAGDIREFVAVAKRLRPPQSGPHAAAAPDPAHWAYWRREALAYAAGGLPTGPGLAAPHCYGVVDEVIYLQDVGARAEQPRRAAHRLGVWQASAAVPEVGWLAGHQLAQRIEVTSLDWSTVDADRRLEAIWARRHELFATLDPVPRVLSHGDFHIDQLRDAGDTTIVLDWGTLGVAPVGADLAHLALSTLVDVDDEYIAAVRGRLPADAIRVGYRVTLALTGVSRIHWMLTNGVPIPPGYQDFVLDHAR
jgi:hypothetical protein